MALDKSGLARFWDGLKAFQNRVAIGLTVVLLFVLYFTIFAVVAIVARLMGKDLLHPDLPEPGTHWPEVLACVVHGTDPPSAYAIAGHAMSPAIWHVQSAGHCVLSVQALGSARQYLMPVGWQTGAPSVE